MGRFNLLVAVCLAACVGAAVAGGGTSHVSAAQTGGWWWTQGYAADEVALRWAGDAPYWNIGCAGIGTHRYYNVLAKAVGSRGQTIGSQAPGVARSTWKWQHFRCIRVLKNGWTAFEVYVLGDAGFKITPPRGRRFVVTKPIIFP
jgi:hypothetical protein